jgi:hypothetical protein
MKLKIYFSKSSHLPCVEYGDSVLKAEDLEVNVPVIGQWFPNESPSWALVGEADEIILNNGKITIGNNKEYVSEGEIMKSLDN